MRVRNNAFALLALWSLLALSTRSRAQSRTVEINGVITDSQNAIVPGATVAIANEATGVVQSTTTNDAGLYHVQNLIPGSYRVEVSKPGFKTFAQTGFVMDVGRVVRLD